MDDEGLVDALTPHMHDAWIESNPDLPRYAAASEHIREGARVMVRAALTGIERAGYKLIRDAGVRSYPTT